MAEIQSKEDDAKAAELDKKVEDALKEWAESYVEMPDSISNILQNLMPKDGKPEDLQKVYDMLMRAYRELPNLSAILGHYTGVLSAYASFRTLKKQEKIAQDNLRATKLLAGGTILLAIATSLLVLVTVLRG